jgi:hypothetical protein
LFRGAYGDFDVAGALDDPKVDRVIALRWEAKSNLSYRRFG